MQKKTVFLGYAVLLAAIMLFLFYAPLVMQPADRPDYARSTLSITRADGKVFPFAVEVAASDREQIYGLMFIHRLDADRGMIFLYNPPRPVAFWMKNTLIPLDMLFVLPDGTIGRIVANARPQDVTPIPSDVPVSAVIEIAGGMAGRDGLEIGDKVASPVLSPSP